MHPQVWLITGCSSGFGYHFALSLLSRGDFVIATSRDLFSLASLRAKGATTLQLDITSTQSIIETTISEALAIHGRVDVLVNNAGYIQIGAYEALGEDEWRSQFETNVFGTIKMTMALLPHFRRQKSGVIVVIGSLCGWVGHPAVGAYAGTKFAIEGIMESLDSEVRSLGIKTLLIESGRFRTSVLSSNNLRTKPTEIEDYMGNHANILKSIQSENGSQPGDPQKLVNVVIDLVKGEGVAEGKEVPIRMPLGNDAWEEISDKIKRTARIMEEWEDVIRSTDFIS